MLDYYSGDGDSTENSVAENDGTARLNAIAFAMDLAKMKNNGDVKALIEDAKKIKKFLDAQS